METVRTNVNENLAFLDWFANKLVKSMYPGAPFARWDSILWYHRFSSLVHYSSSRKNMALCLFREGLVKPLLHIPPTTPLQHPPVILSLLKPENDASGVTTMAPGFALFAYTPKDGEQLHSDFDKMTLTSDRKTTRHILSLYSFHHIALSMGWLWIEQNRFSYIGIECITLLTSCSTLSLLIDTAAYEVLSLMPTRNKVGKDVHLDELTSTRYVTNIVNRCWEEIE